MSLPFTIKDYIEANKKYNNLSINEKESIKLNAQKALHDVLTEDNSIKVSDKDREQMNKILESNFSKKEIDNLFKHFPNWKKIIKGNNNE